jgi:hypothetical protein
MAEFLVRGPYVIPKEKARNGDRLLYDEFWEEHAELEEYAGKSGVYVFGVRAGRGYTPLYVGKATRSFKKECFNPTNKHKYSDAMKDYIRCAPVIFFVVHPSQRGKVNSAMIDEIETFLIQTAYSKNPDIQNIKKTRMPDWSIRGVVRNTTKGASKSATEFRKLIGT